MGYRDSDGYFHIVGRRDNQLKVGGHKVNLQEIEDALIATGLLIEASVLGIEDRLAGHKLAAVAVPIDGRISENDVLGKCNALLPRYKVPSEILFTKNLPKNSSGKVDRKECLQLLTNSGPN